MRKKDRPVGEEDKRGGRRDQRRLSSLFSLSLAKKLTSSLALRAVHIRQAGSCAIVVVSKEWARYNVTRQAQQLARDVPLLNQHQRSSGYP